MRNSSSNNNNINNNNGSFIYQQAHSPPSKKINQVNYDTRYHFLNSKQAIDKLSQHTNSQSTTHSDTKFKKQICSIHLQKQEQPKQQQPKPQFQLSKQSAAVLKRTCDQSHKRAMSSLSITEKDKQQFYSSSNIVFNPPISEPQNDLQSQQALQFRANINISNDHEKTAKDHEQTIKNEEIACKIIAICSHQIASHPSNLKLYQKRMQQYLKIGYFQNAIADADFILQNQPDNITALCSRGNAFMKLQIIDTAIYNFEEVLRIDPDNVNAALLKASCLNIQGDYIKAIDQYEDALEKDYEKSSMLNLSFNAKRNLKGSKNSSSQNLHSKNTYNNANPGLFYYDRLEQEELQLAGISDCNSNIKKNDSQQYQIQQQKSTLNSKASLICNRNSSPNKLNSLDAIKNSPHWMTSKHQKFNSYSSSPSGIITSSSSSTSYTQQQQSQKSQSQFLFRSQSDKTQINFNNHDSNCDADEQANLFFTKGYLARQKGEFLNAIELYSLALQLKPDFLKAVLNRGFLFDKLDEQERAYEDYTRAIAIDCKCAFAYFNRGISLDKLNHWEDAVDDFSKAIEIDQTNSDFYLNRGNALQKLELHQQAIFDYTKCMDFQTTKLSSVLISRAMSFEKSNDLERAKNDYERSLQLNTPEAYVCCSRLANIYERKKEIQVALSFFNKALEMNPKSMYCLVKRAQLYSNEKLFELACEDITTAIEIQGNLNSYHQTPQCSSLLYLRAKNLRHLNRFIEAAEDLLSAVTLNPNDRSILALLSNTMLQLGEYEDALQYVEAEIKLHGTSKQSLYNRSFCNIKLLRFIEAQIDLEVLLKAEPNNPKIKESLTVCSLNQKQSTEVIKNEAKVLFEEQEANDQFERTQLSKANERRTQIIREQDKNRVNNYDNNNKNDNKIVVGESKLSQIRQPQQLGIAAITTSQKSVSKVPILNLPISYKVSQIKA